MSYAQWSTRVLAQLLDMLVILPFLAVYLVGSVFIHGSALIVFGVVLLLLAVSVSFYNRCIVMGRTGWSLGKMLVGIRVISERTGQPVGVLRIIVREFCHSIDMTTVVGMMLPLFPRWDSKGQTVADRIMKTVVIDQRWTREHHDRAASPAAAAH